MNGELTPQQKAQLDKNIRDMLSKGASEDDVKRYAADFHASFSVKKKDNGFAGTVGLKEFQSPSTAQSGLRETEGELAGVGYSVGELPTKEKEENIDADPFGSELGKIYENTVRLGESKVSTTGTTKPKVKEKLKKDIPEQPKLLPSQSTKAIEKLQEAYTPNTATADLYVKRLAQSQGREISSIDQFDDEQLKAFARPGNFTDQLVIEKSLQGKKARQSISNNSTVEEMAIDFASKNNPKIKAQADVLMAKGEPVSYAIPESMRGQAMYEFLSDPSVQEAVQSSPELMKKFKQESYNLIQTYPDFGVKIISSIISQERERRGLNNSFVNVPEKQETDEIINDLFEKGEIPFAAKKLYEDRIRPNLGLVNVARSLVGKEQIKTPGIVEGAVGSFGKGFADLAGGVYEVSRLRNLVTKKEDRLFTDLEKTYKEPQFEPEGIHKFSNVAGHFLGQSLSIGGQATFLNKLNLIKSPMTAMRLAGGLQAYNNYIPQARMEFPNEPLKQTAYASLMSALEMGTEGIFDDVKAFRAFTGDIAPKVKQVIKEFTNKNITAAAAKESLLDVIKHFAPKYSKNVIKGMSQNTLEEMAMQGLGDAADAVFQGTPLDKQIDANEWANTAITSFLGSAPISMIAATGSTNRPASMQMIYEMAQNPDFYKEQINKFSELDDELAATKDEKIGNLDYAAKVLQDISDRPMSESKRAEYVTLSLAQKISEDEAAKITDPTIKNERLQEVKEIEQDKLDVLNNKETSIEQFKEKPIDDTSQQEGAEIPASATVSSGTEAAPLTTTPIDIASDKAALKNYVADIRRDLSKFRKSGNPITPTEKKLKEQADRIESGDYTKEELEDAKKLFAAHAAIAKDLRDFAGGKTTASSEAAPLTQPEKKSESTEPLIQPAIEKDFKNKKVDIESRRNNELSNLGKDISLEDVLKVGNKFTDPNGNVWEVHEHNEGKVRQVTKNGDSFILFRTEEISNEKLRENLDFLRYAAGKKDASKSDIEDINKKYDAELAALETPEATQQQTSTPIPKGEEQKLKVTDYVYNDKDKSGGSGIYVDITTHKELADMFDRTGRGKLDFFAGSAMHRKENLKNRTGEFKELSNRQANRVYDNMLDNVDKSKGTNVGEFRASMNMLITFLDTVNSPQSKEISEKLKPILKEAEISEEQTRKKFWELHKIRTDEDRVPKELMDEWVASEKKYKDFDVSQYRSNDITGQGQGDKFLLESQTQQQTSTPIPRQDLFVSRNTNESVYKIGDKYFREGNDIRDKPVEISKDEAAQMAWEHDGHAVRQNVVGFVPHSERLSVLDKYENRSAVKEKPQSTSTPIGESKEEKAEIPKQEKINDLVERVNVFNKMPRNAKGRSQEINSIRVAANELGLRFDDRSGELFNKNGGKVKKVNADAPRKAAEGFNQENYSDDTRKHFEVAKNNLDALTGLPIKDANGHFLNRKQLEAAVKSIEDGKPNNAAKAIFDYLESAVNEGSVEITDRITGDRATIPIRDYFDAFKEPVADLTYDEVEQLNYELDQESFNFTEDYGQEIIPTKIEADAARPAEKSPAQTGGGKEAARSGAKAQEAEERLKTAQSNYDKAAKALQDAEDKIAKKKSTQADIFGGAKVQKEMFGIGKDEAKEILDPLKQKVKEAKAELEAAQKAATVPDNQPELISDEVGKPPTKEPPPPSEPPIAETPPAEEKEPPLRNKALATRLVQSENIPADARKGIEAQGLQYIPQDQQEAENIADAIIDELGMDEAVLQAQAQSFGGDVNTLIQTQSLNRLYDKELKAKTSEEKFSIAEKFADIAIRLDEWARDKAGRGIAAIGYFYKKSPLGMTIKQNKENKKDFDKWAKPKEKSWDEFLGELHNLPEFKEFVDKKVQDELKKERADQRKERIKKVDDTIDKWIDDIGKGHMGFVSIVPPPVIIAALKGVKAAWRGGESVVKIIQDAIDFVTEKIGDSDWNIDGFKKKIEAIVGKPETKNALDRYKDNLNKQIANLDRQIENRKRDNKKRNKIELDEEAKALVEKRNAKKKQLEEIAPLSETEEYQLRQLEKFRKKLKGLSEEQKDEVIRKSFAELIKNGALKHEDFRKIIANATGRGDLTPEQSAKMKELVRHTNAVDDFAKRLQERKTPQSFENYKKSQIRAAKAARELSDMFDKKADYLKVIAASVQGNTLSLTNVAVLNPLFNIANQLSTRLPIGALQSLYGIITGNKQFNTVLSVSAQKQFFKEVLQGLKEANVQLVTGMNRMDYDSKEIFTDKIRPFKSARELWHQVRSSKFGNAVARMMGKEEVERTELLTARQKVHRALQIAPGTTAEIIFRLLNYGDKPMRFGAGGATAAGFANSLGIKSGTLDWDIFLEFPREEAYRIYKSKGLSTKEAEEKADYIKESIVQEGKRSTFQQDNLFVDFINGAFNTVSTKLGGEKDSGASSLIKTSTISPYIKIPSNAYWSYLNIAHPLIAVAQSTGHLINAKRLRSNGENVKADLQIREARYWAGHAAVGVALNMIVIPLVKAGIIRPSSDEDDPKKEREGEKSYEQQGTIKIGNITVPLRNLGSFGMLSNSIAKDWEEMTPEQRESRDLLLMNLFEFWDKDDLKELQNGVFSNSAGLLGALGEGGTNTNRFLLNQINMYANLVQPAALAQISRAQLPYYTTRKADSFLKELDNSLLERSSLYRKLSGKYPPTKLNIWGEPMKKDDNFWFRMLGINKANKDNFAQPIYEDAKKSNDIGFFPPAISDRLGGVKLTTEQYSKLEKYVGSERKKLISPYVNNMALIDGYDQTYGQIKDDETKKKVLEYLYGTGRLLGLQKFYLDYPEFAPKEKAEIDKEAERLFEVFKKSVDIKLKEQE